MTDAIRSFLAVPVNDAVADPLMATVNASTDSLPPLRTTPRSNLHLTLVFLGTITRATLNDRVIPRVNERLADARPGRVHFRQVAGFPDPEKPRHLVLEGYASPTIEDLQRHLREALSDITGQTTGDNSWRPHVTVGRFRDRSPRAITPTPWQADLPVGDVCLYESQQGLHGPVYEIRERWRLGQEPEQTP